MNNKDFVIPSNYVAVPTTVTAFVLKFQQNGESYTTTTIALVDDKHTVRKERSAVYLPEEGCVQIVEKCCNNQLLRICLTSSNENHIRIISIQPFYVICNFSNHQLKYRAFCIYRNETMKYDDVSKMILEKSESKSIPDNSQTADNIFKGCDCSIFCDISKKTPKTINFSKDFHFYIIIQHDDHSLSAPILLNKPIVRMAYGIRLKETNIPLAASITQHKEQYFVSIYNDRFPFIEIDNQTNIEIFAAEADFGDFSKSMKPKKSMHDDNFQWCCSILPYSRMFYSPPSINERFPEKQNANIHLIFGCGNSKLLPGGNIQWSIPVETNKMDEKYLALPLYGDIKLSSSIQNKTVIIRLEHIDFRKEFNVKVVHNKLSSPNERSTMIIAENMTVNQNNENDMVKEQLVRPPTESSSKSMTFSNFNTIVFIKEVVLVLYDNEKDQLYKMNYIASIFFDDAIACYTEEDRKLEFGFNNIQIDNNLYSSGKYDFPVVLCRQTEKSTNDGIDKNAIDNVAIMPTPFSLPLMQSHLLDNQIGHFEILLANFEFSAKEVICSLQPLRVYIEDKFIAVLLDFAIENLPSNIIWTPDINERVECMNAGEIVMPKIITEQILSFLSEPLRLNRICIKPLSILLSVHTCIRMYIALDHSPLHFAEFEYKNIYTTTMRLGYNIGMHYVSDAIFGAGWVVGSLEILGSSSILARSVSSGLWDFVSMPVQGLMRGPWGVLLGITYGSASLIKNITAGTVNSVTKLAASVARNLDRLTLDDEHLERTEALRRVRPMGITHGLSQGLTGFGINLLGAVGGIARHALEAKSSVEVFTGLGKGIIGVVTKPISGAAELLALTGQGVLHTVGFNAMPMARDIQTNEDHAFPLSVTKVAWKILSKIDDVDSVLVVASAKHVESEEKNVTIAITSKLVLLISDTSNELATVLSINRTRAIIETKNSTKLILDMKNDEDHQQFQHKRILQYLSRTHIQSVENRQSFEDDIQSYPWNVSNRNVLVCENPETALYLARYIQFLYYCLNTVSPMVDI